MKKKVMTIMLVLCIFGFIGCVSYRYKQELRNETGFTVTEVYIRDTGTTNWTKTEVNGIGNARQIILFSIESFSSETPGIGNKDIVVRDSNGVLYMKNNVSITFSTTKITDPLFFNPGPGEVLTESTPIIFTAKDRLPMLYVVNQTGYALNLIAPVKQSVADKGRAQFQPMEMNRSVDVTYTIGQAQYTEQVTMKNEDATVNLTKRPPTLTIVNNVGATINTIFLRVPGSPSWIGGNIVIRGGTVQLGAAGGAAQAGDISGSIVNKDSMKIWLGNVNITGNVFDIRIDDVQTNSSYVKSNVQVTNDMTITFTQADKR